MLKYGFENIAFFDIIVFNKSGTLVFLVLYSFHVFFHFTCFGIAKILV